MISRPEGGARIHRKTYRFRFTTMPQSLSKIYVHLVFSTKNRERVLGDGIRRDFHSYLGGVLRGVDCHPLEINSEPDHVHLLFELGRKVALSEVVGGLKKSATEWLRGAGPAFRGFHWQAGYGAFSVSPSSVEDVREYIRNQREHHRVRTFQEEFRMFLRRSAIEFDERYVWD
jgi:REP element-mobilizing transposase RayT